TVTKIHSHIQRNQALFREGLVALNHPLFNRKNLIMTDPENHGHFLTFKLPSEEITQKLVKELAAKKIKTDSRGNRLRFGFGLYHDADTIQRACDIIGRYF